MAEVLPAGASRGDLTVDVVSHFTAADNAVEEIRIDGETHRLTLRYARGLGNGWEAGAELSILDHGGGFLDAAVNEWHEIFDLPRLGRDRVENGLLIYRYQQSGETLVDVTDASAGIGDIVLSFGKTLAGKPAAIAGETPALALRGQVSLPTGDADSLYGSGGVNAALSLQGATYPGPRWALYGNAGISYLGEGDVLAALQRDWVGFAGAGVRWNALTAVSLKLQADAQTSAYSESALDQLNSYAAQLTLGADFNFGERYSLELGIVENVGKTAASPDVGISLTGRVNWGR